LIVKAFAVATTQPQTCDMVQLLKLLFGTKVLITRILFF